MGDKPSTSGTHKVLKKLFPRKTRKKKAKFSVSASASNTQQLKLTVNHSSNDKNIHYNIPVSMTYSEISDLSSDDLDDFTPKQKQLPKKLSSIKKNQTCHP